MRPDRGDAACAAALAAPGRRICLPAAVKRRGTALLNQQFWLWGQDIRRPDGNLLLLRGVARERPPANVQGSRAYVLCLGGDRMIVLWGFGLFYGDPAVGGLYLSRFRLAPLLIDDTRVPVGVWQPVHLPARRPPAGRDDDARAHALLVDALRWMSAYERWVIDEFGAAYRRASLARWPRVVCAAEDGAGRWGRLADRCDSSLRRAGVGDRRMADAIRGARSLGSHVHKTTRSSRG